MSVTDTFLWCILILPKPDSVRRKLLNDVHTFYSNDYFVFGPIRTCLGVSSHSMLMWIFLYSCLKKLLLLQRHQAEIMIVKRLIQGRNNMTAGTRLNQIFTVLGSISCHFRP